MNHPRSGDQASGLGRGSSSRVVSFSDASTSTCISCIEARSVVYWCRLGKRGRTTLGLDVWRLCVGCVCPRARLRAHPDPDHEHEYWTGLERDKTNRRRPTLLAHSTGTTTNTQSRDETRPSRSSSRTCQVITGGTKGTTQVGLSLVDTALLSTRLYGKKQAESRVSL